MAPRLAILFFPRDFLRFLDWNQDVYMVRPPIWIPWNFLPRFDLLGSDDFAENYFSRYANTFELKNRSELTNICFGAGKHGFK